MKTIRMTIDEPLLVEVDRVTAEMQMTRSGFIRQALQVALRQHNIRKLEQQHANGYALHLEPGEFDTWLDEQDWSGV